MLKSDLGVFTIVIDGVEYYLQPEVYRVLKSLYKERDMLKNMVLDFSETFENEQPNK